jgi:hypothetical protein
MSVRRENYKLNAAGRVRRLRQLAKESASACQLIAPVNSKTDESVKILKVARLVLGGRELFVVWARDLIFIEEKGTGRQWEVELPSVKTEGQYRFAETR